MTDQARDYWSNFQRQGPQGLVSENLCLQEYGGIGLFSFESITPLFPYSSLYFSGLLGRMAGDAVDVTAVVTEDNLKRAGDELFSSPHSTP